jgi:hypothetical protein
MFTRKAHGQRGLITAQNTGFPFGKCAAAHNKSAGHPKDSLTDVKQFTIVTVVFEQDSKHWLFWLLDFNDEALTISDGA